MKDNMKCGMLLLNSLGTGNVIAAFVLAQGFYALLLFSESFAYLLTSFISFISFRKLKKVVENSSFKKMCAFIKKWNDHYNFSVTIMEEKLNQ